MGDKACAPAGDVLDIIGLNYASSRYDEDAKKYPERMMVGSETMVADLPYNWSRVKKYRNLSGISFGRHGIIWEKPALEIGRIIPTKVFLCWLVRG